MFSVRNIRIREIRQISSCVDSALFTVIPCLRVLHPVSYLYFSEYHAGSM